MSEEKNTQPRTVFDVVEGLEPIDASALEPFTKAMEEAIPEIVREEEERRVLAAESRHRQLKC
jgi:hypothetical protein